MMQCHEFSSDYFWRKVKRERTLNSVFSFVIIFYDYFYSLPLAIAYTKQFFGDDHKTNNVSGTKWNS